MIFKIYRIYFVNKMDSYSQYIYIGKYKYIYI